MNTSCSDRERIFLDGSAEEWAALELHAQSCSDCARELRAWKALSMAAEEMRDYREDAALWAKIATSLGPSVPQQAERRGLPEWLAAWRGNPLGWQTALTGALVVLLALSGAYVLTHPHRHDPQEGHLLRNSTLAEVERTELEYMKAIDTLAADAKPQLEFPASPLVASYQEKLIVLDSAIDELRVQAGQNPSNAHLRYQLLAMYQEKQQTLEDVLELKR